MFLRKNFKINQIKMNFNYNFVSLATGLEINGTRRMATVLWQL